MCSPLTLSVTTRGIGINLSAFYADVANLICTTGGREPTTRLPEIYPSYRALLALVEKKMLEVGSYSHYEHIYRYSPKLYHYKMYYGDLLHIPIMFKRYIEAINVLKHKDIRYVPAMSTNIDPHGKFIPRPENIVLSNLRQTVVALEALDDDDDNSLLHRENFYRNNPIPGAIWDTRQYKLMNADEIMPDDYNFDYQITNDINKLQSLRYKLQNFSEYINKKPANQKGSQISQAIFICNKMGRGDLRVPDRALEQPLDDYYWNCRPTGNINEFYSRFKLKNKNLINDGAMFLLGEYTNNESFARPIFELRSEHVNSYWYPNVSYKSSYLAYHNKIVYNSLRNA